MLVLVTLFAITFSLVWLYFKKKHSYFDEHGIPSEPGYLPFGSKIIWKMLRGEGSILQVAEDLYDNFPNHKAFGYYRPMGEPVLVIKDLEIAKRIMIKDFDHFTDRAFLNLHPDANKYLSKMLAALKGEEWKSNRQMISPLFTAQKLKTMVPWIHKMADELTIYLEEQGDIDSKESFGKFTMELLGNLGVGVRPNVIQTEENVFYDQVRFCYLHVKNKFG